MLEGGYADSPSDPNIQGPSETFSGLSQCAENHIKTLMTGVVQPETPFYAGSATVGMRTKKTTNPAWRDGMITGLSPDDGPHTITLSDTNGKIIRKVITFGTEVGLTTTGIAAGRYIISIHGRKRTTALAILFCP
jgi:hypothetical protein